MFYVFDRLNGLQGVLGEEKKHLWVRPVVGVDGDVLK